MLRPLQRILRDLFGGTETLRYPEERLDKTHVESIRGVAYLARPEACIGCEACYQTCPLRAIRMVEEEIVGEKKKVPIINAGMCSFCGLCVEVCPTNALDNSSLIAIVMDEPGYWITPKDSERINELRKKGEISWKP